MLGIVDWAGRMKQMAEFVGLTQSDLELIQSTAPVLAPHAEALTGAIYDHFLLFPETRRFFLGEDGEVDQERITRRRHSLNRWLENTIQYQVDGDLPVFLLAAGLVHSHPPSNRAHLGSVPSRFMLGTISFAQTAITQLLFQEVDHPQKAMLASLAWNKLLMVQLDILLAGYVDEVPIQPTEQHEA